MQHWTIWPLTVLSAVAHIFHTGPAPSGCSVLLVKPCILMNYILVFFFLRLSFSSSFLYCSSICFNKCGPFIWITKLKASWNLTPVHISVHMWVRLQCASEVECVHNERQIKLMFYLSSLNELFWNVCACKWLHMAASYFVIVKIQLYYPCIFIVLLLTLFN